MECKNCGKEVADKAVVCLGCGGHPRGELRYCKDCGGENEPESEVCAKCGESLDKQEEGGKGKLVAVALFIVLGGTGAYLWLF